MQSRSRARPSTAALSFIPSPRALRAVDRHRPGRSDAFSTQLADVNGDGKADAVAFNGSSTWVMLSTGTSFAAPILWSTTNFYGGYNTHSTMLGDLNNDGLADAIAFNGTNTWIMLGVR